MFLHYAYLNERQSRSRDHVGWYLVRVADPGRAGELAEALDARFANSAYETKTATEKAFLQAWANQIGDIGSIMIAVLGTVLFTILLVVGNTMAQAIRERTERAGRPEGARVQQLTSAGPRAARINAAGRRLGWACAGLHLARRPARRSHRRPSAQLLPARA